MQPQELTMHDLLPNYPRTLHLGSSGGGKSKHSAPMSTVAGAHLVVEEKVDGSHAGLCFDDDANLVLFHRNTILGSPPHEAEFRPLYKLARLHMDTLWETLQTCYVLYGEWALLTHSVYYDALPAYFLEDDIYDRERAAFLSTPARKTLLAELPPEFSSSVHVLATGVFDSEEELAAHVGHSQYRSSKQDVSVVSEGLYIKHEEDGIVKGRYKWVRESFVEHIKSAKHWQSQPPRRNVLRLPIGR